MEDTLQVEKGDVCKICFSGHDANGVGLRSKSVDFGEGIRVVVAAVDAYL